MTDVTTAPIPDVARLRTWLEHAVGPGGDLTIMPVQGGASNLIYRIERDGRSYALRRPPAVANDASSNNILREITLLRALASSDIPHTRLVAGCDDPHVIGAPFALLEWHPGFAGKDPLPAFIADDQAARREMAFELVDALASLANTDWLAIDLEGFGNPDGFLERQVSRWSSQLERYKVREVEGLSELADWLRDNTPTTQRTALIHGDYQFINVMYAPEPPVRLTAIVDWEMATIGDPLLDLGWMLAGWQEPGEEESHANYIDWTSMPRRQTLAARYAEKTGLSVAQLPYYMALSLYKLAIIMEGAYARYRAGKSSHPIHASMEQAVPAMVRRGLRFAGTR